MELNLLVATLPRVTVLKNMTYLLRGNQLRYFLYLSFLLSSISGSTQIRQKQQSAASGITDVAITNKVRLEGVKRFGINLGRETFYDSGQLLRNLTFRNPGFEGESWQSILRCKVVTRTTCVDGNQYAVWPDDFLKGAHFEFISGDANGL